MSYVQALEKGWADLSGLSGPRNVSVKFLSDEYTLDLDKRLALSLSCNIPAKDYLTIIILHYLAKKITPGKMPALSGEWIDFNHVEGGEAYFPTFKKRTIDLIIKKFGRDPEALIKSAGRFPSKRGEAGDIGVTIYPFEETPILIAMWKPDDEFGPDANILFDSSISRIFCTEDIVVLTEIVTHNL